MNPFESSYRVEAYTPDKQWTVGGLLALCAALAVVGAILGAVANYVSQWFYFILIFPAAIGFALGAVGSKVITFTKIRHPLWCALAGFLGGVFAMATMHYAGYLQFKKATSEVPADMLAQIRALSPAEREEGLATLSPEEKENARIMFDVADSGDGFFGYMDLMAKQGVTISRARSSSDKGINLGHAGSRIYWGIEVLIVGIIALMMLRKQAAEPFCESCAEWKPSELLGALSGDQQQISAAVQSGALRNWQPFTSGGEQNVHVTLNACKNCGSSANAVVHAERVELNRKKQEKRTTVAKVVYPGAAVANLRAVFAGPVSPPDGSAPPA